MRIREKREVEVIKCDFCYEETPYVNVCGLCGREGCSKDGLKEHFAFAINSVYRYKDGKRNITHICKECVAEGRKFTIGELFDIIIDKC